MSFIFTDTNYFFGFYLEYFCSPTLVILPTSIGSAYFLVRARQDISKAFRPIDLDLEKCGDYYGNFKGEREVKNSADILLEDECLRGWYRSYLGLGAVLIGLFLVVIVL